MDRSGAVCTYQTIDLGDGLVEADEEAIQAVTAALNSSLVGPEGGQVLVDRTVELINSMFREERRITHD